MKKFQDILFGRSSTTILVVVRPPALLAEITGDRRPFASFKLKHRTENQREVITCVNHF